MSDTRDVLAACWLAADADGSLEWAQRILRESRDAEHCGDCTKIPMTCNRCVADQAFEMSDAMLAALAAAGLVVVPVERCAHEWIDIRNEVVQSGEICRKCFAVRAPKP
jgi:hypothetical protein